MLLSQRCVLNGIIQRGMCFRMSRVGVSKQALLSKGAALPGGGIHRSQSGGAPGGAERTLIAVKPDGVQRRHVGKIIQRFEQRGFKLVGLKMTQATDALLSQHYVQLVGKPFYPSLVDYMTSGPVVAMVWEGLNVVQSSRRMVGPTDPTEAPPGTVRGDFSLHVSRNVVHASDSVEGAQREISLWFDGTELLDWECYDHSLTFKEDQ